jgi:SAM-dependent methyltransferase
MVDSTADAAQLATFYGAMSSLDGIRHALAAAGVDSDGIQASDLYRRDLDCHNLGMHQMLEVLVDVAGEYGTLVPGDTVLDVGCGGGIDSFLAAARTGDDGRVIALDFLPEMLERTASGAAEAGFHNVEPLESEMEAIELPDDSVDVIVSNGVVNLSPRKARVMAECARVLRPGGRLCVSDLTVVQDELPPEVATQPAAWAGCVAGALEEEDFIAQLERAGFEGIEVLHREPLGIDDCALYPLFTDEVIRLMRELIPPERHREVATSVIVRARYPEQAPAG